MVKGKKSKKLVGARKGKSSRAVVAALLGNNLELIELNEGLDGKGDQPLGYASLADRRAEKDIEREIVARILHEVSEGRLTAIKVSHRSDPGWESEHSRARLDMPTILKSKRDVNTAAPDSISRLALGWAVADNVEGGFVYVPMLVTLGFEISGKMSVAVKRRSARRSIPQAIGRRPMLDDLFVNKPTDVEVTRAVRQFMQTNARLRKKCRELAVEQGCGAKTRKFRAMRELGLLQMDTLLAVEKAYFGAGEGEEILSHALTKPLQRARRVKRGKTALTRDDVIDLYWTDAFQHPDARFRPPFVKL